MYCVTDFKICVPRDRMIDVNNYGRYPTCINTRCKNAKDICMGIGNLCQKKKSSSFY